MISPGQMRIRVDGSLMQLLFLFDQDIRIEKTHTNSRLSTLINSCSLLTMTHPHTRVENSHTAQILALKLINYIFLFSTWKEGKFIVIDDSIEHEVWHNGTTFRMILIVDFWHPDLPRSERDTLSAI